MLFLRFNINLTTHLCTGPTNLSSFVLVTQMQCWVDIDTSSATYTNPNTGKKWEEKTVVFTATATNTWIQILGNDNPDQLYIDDITMVECLP